MWLKDPVTKKYSVSLTFLTTSFLLAIAGGVYNVYTQTEKSGPFMELVYITVGLYFSRRASFRAGSMSINNKQHEEGRPNEEKVETTSK